MNLPDSGLNTKFLCGLSAIMFLLAVSRLCGESFTINTPGGPVQIEISHLGPSGSLVTPGDPTSPSFRPPTVFSAPLPSGSGARALGLAGAFTAVADDATAASWNPAGLIQLERPEASCMVRYSLHDNKHSSDSEDFQAGKDNFQNMTLNYLSAVCPFTIGEHNVVLSVNYQEAYDFEQKFSASSLGQATSSARQSESQNYTDTQVDHITAGSVDINVTSYLRTSANSYLSQILSSDMLTGLDFEQEGIIDAVTPAMAFEVTPKVCLGYALNFYGDNSIGGHPIRSSTTARYGGQSGSSVNISDVRTTSGTYEYSGTWHSSYDILGIPVAVDVPISGSGNYSPFSDTADSSGTRSTVFDGVYTEENTFKNLTGFNATFGALIFVSSRMNLAFTVDTPWTAYATQTKTVNNTITTYDSTHTTALNVTESSTTESKNVEFNFPLYCAAGMVWRWNNVLWSSLDISQTRWSEFSYKAGDDDLLNPLDGSTHGENPIADCWSVRYGMEYLLVLAKTEVPFRGGVAWEQRPAIDEPDEFWQLSLGTGISIGRDPGRFIVDIAYNGSFANDVFGSLVPDQKGLTTDAVEHQVFLSCIRHF